MFRFTINNHKHTQFRWDWISLVFPVCSFISMAWESAAAKGGWLGRSPILSLGYAMYIAWPTIMPPLLCSMKKPHASQWPSLCLLIRCSSFFLPWFPQKEDPRLQAVVKLDLSSYANYTSTPAQATQAPDEGPVYSLPVSLLLPALAHVGPSVWQ